MKIFTLLFLSIITCEAPNNFQGKWNFPGTYSFNTSAGGGGGTVAHDTRTTSLQNTAVSSVTYSHTVTGANPALVVFVVLTGTAQTVSSITYNAVGLTLIGSAVTTLGVTQARVEAWGLSGPATGAHNVVVTLSANNSSWDSIANSFTGTAASSTFDGFQSAEQTGSNLSVSITVTTGDTGDMVVDCTGSTADNGTTSGAGQTQRWQDNSGTSNTQGSTKAGGASVTMTETWDAGDNGKILIGLNVNHN